MTKVFAAGVTFILLIHALLFPTSYAASSALKAQSASVQLTFDNQTLKLPQGQYVFALNGTNYVPIRFVSYALQKSVQWDQQTATVTVVEPTKAEQTVLKEYLMNAIAGKGEASSKGGMAIAVTPKQVNFKFDGKVKKLPAGQSGYILNGSIYVPVRFMAESIGTVVTWDPKTKQISGVSKAYAAAQSGSAADSSGSAGNAEEAAAGEGSDGTVAGGEAAAGGGANGAASGSVSGGTGTGGGAQTPAKPTKASIEAAAESRLNALKTACYNDLMTIGSSYLTETDPAKQQQLIAKGQAKVNACRVSFNKIVSETESVLLANGYSTDKISAYRQAFEDELAAGEALMKELAG